MWCIASPASATPATFPHPLIISESGRAIAAHHSVLIFNVLGNSALDRFRVDGQEIMSSAAENRAGSRCAI
jgi:arginine decarboxylase